MLTVYLACLIFGGILLSVSIFAHSDADGDFHDGDFHTDVHTDLTTDVEVHADADVATHPADTNLHGESVTSAIQYLSFRNVVFFLAFFGLTGSLLTLLGIPLLAVLFTALGMGLFTATLSHKLMTYLKKSESGRVIHVNELEGFTAKVTISLSKTRRGKISVTDGSRHLQLVAGAAEEAGRDAFQCGDSVIVLKVEDGTAYVVEEEFIH